MNLPTLIDVALGLSLVFFLLASIGSVLAELWAAHRKLRHRLLRDTVNRLLGPDIAKHFWEHSLILPLYAAPPADEEDDDQAPAPPAAASALAKAGRLVADAAAKSHELTVRARRWLSSGRKAEAPAYLEAELFATVVLDIASGQGALGAIPNDRTAWEATIRANITEIIGDANDLEDHLLALLRQLPANTPDLAAALKAAVAKWYEEAMQRASGTYRRQTQKSLLVVGTILAVGLNVDAVRIAQILYLNPQLRSDVAAQAEAVLKDNAPEAPAPTEEKPGTTTGTANGKTAANTTAAANTTTTAAGNTSANNAATNTTAPAPTSTAPTTDATNTATPPPTPREKLREATGQLRDLAKIGFPLGWMPEWKANFLQTEKAPAPWLGSRAWHWLGRKISPCFDPGRFRNFLAWTYAKVDTLLATGWLALLAKFAGLAATSLAVCLGAPFWFDVMGRLVKLRSSAGAEAEKAKNPKANSGNASADGSSPPPTGGSPAPTGGNASGNPSATPAASTTAKPFPTAAVALANVATGFDAARAYWLAEFADHAYETNETLLRTWLTQQGFTLAKPFSKSVALPGGGTTDTQAFLATAGNVAVLSFRGTEKKLSDWLTDAHAEQTTDTYLDPATQKNKIVIPGALHTGFITAFNSLADEIAKIIAPLKGAGVKIHVTGHSLGAALASLAALHLEARPETTGAVATVHTFGSPRVGDPVFAAAFERTFRQRAFRFVNNEDLVTRVPPPKLALPVKGQACTFTYEHVGAMKFIDAQGKLMGDVSFMFRLLNFTTNALGDVKDAVATTLKDHSMALYCANLRNNV